MLPEAVDRLLALPEDARVLDVGGWAAPLNRADWVIDAMPFATRGAMGFSYGGHRERFGADSWVVRDVCDPEPWPFADDAFDVAVCVTTLEDLRDPVRVCREMARVARTGYVEVPTTLAELVWRTPGEGDWLGHSHHHWLVELGGAPGGRPGLGGAAAIDGGDATWSSPDRAPDPSAAGPRATGAPAPGLPAPGTAELVGGEPVARTRPTAPRVRVALKQHSMHADRRLRVTPSMAAELHPREHLRGLWWSGEIDVAERLLIGERLHDELAALVAARFTPSRTEAALRRLEGAALERSVRWAAPARDRVGAAMRRRRGAGGHVGGLEVGPEHVRTGLGAPRDG